MSEPWLGLTMLGLIVVSIMLGFPTAFTLMGLGVFFGFYAFYIPDQYWFDNRLGTPSSCRQSVCGRGNLRRSANSSWELLSRLQLWF